MIGSQLVPYLMHHIIYVKIIPLRNAVRRGGKPAPFGFVYTYTTNTACITAAARGPEKVSNVIIGFTNDRCKRVLQFTVPGTCSTSGSRRIGISCCIVIDNFCGCVY